VDAWLDLVDPDRDQLLEALPVEVADDVLERCLEDAPERPRPRLDGYGEYVFGVMAAMAPDPDDDRIESLEVDFVATKERLVVIRKTSPHGKIWEPECLEAAKDASSVGELIHRLVDDVAESYLGVVDFADGEIDELEDHIDDWPSVRVRRRISALRHDLIHARRTVGATRGKVRRITDKRLDLSNESLFPEDVERLFSDTYETLFRAGEELDVARDLLASSRDYHQALISESQNEIVKKLTVIASILLLPTLIVGFYGQNFVSSFNDFYWSLGVSLMLIVGSTLVQLAVFRWRRWI
jgi:magnesium transporter